MDDYLHIGATPHDEDCQQLGTPGWDPVRARQECRAYVHQLNRMFPDGDFRIVRENHEYGTYYMVGAFYHDDATRKAAFQAEGNSPANWDEEARKELGL